MDQKELDEARKSYDESRARRNLQIIQTAEQLVYNPSKEQQSRLAYAESDILYHTEGKSTPLLSPSVNMKVCVLVADLRSKDGGVDIPDRVYARRISQEVDGTLKNLGNDPGKAAILADAAVALSRSNPTRDNELSRQVTRQIIDILQKPATEVDLNPSARVRVAASALSFAYNADEDTQSPTVLAAQRQFLREARAFAMDNPQSAKVLFSDISKSWGSEADPGKTFVAASARVVAKDMDRPGQGFLSQMMKKTKDNWSPYGNTMAQISINQADRLESTEAQASGAPKSVTVPQIVRNKMGS